MLVHQKIKLVGDHILPLLSPLFFACLQIIQKGIILIYFYLIQGLIKALVFGIIISIISCYFGFNASGGAEGVGRATTISVVTASTLILTSTYFITALFI